MLSKHRLNKLIIEERERGSSEGREGGRKGKERRGEKEGMEGMGGDVRGGEETRGQGRLR